MTLTKAEWLLEIAIDAFGKKPMSEITAPVVRRCLRKVEAKGNYETARRLRTKIGAVFRHAIASGTAKADPAYALRDARTLNAGQAKHATNSPPDRSGSTPKTKSAPLKSETPHEIGGQLL